MLTVASRTTNRVQVVATGAAAFAAAILFRVGDPSQGGYPRCPFHAATGLRCPGCGTQRGLHALLTGDLPAAFGYNALMVVALPFVVYAFAQWALRAFDRPPLPIIRAPLPLVRFVPALVVAFAVVRNLPVGRVLAP